MATELERISQTIWDRIGSRPISGRTVVLKMKYQDFRIVSRSCSLARPVAGRDEFLEIGLTLLQKLLPVAKPVRLLGLTLAGLVEPQGVAEPAEPVLPL
jgi:DNA polymerase-4